MKDIVSYLLDVNIPVQSDPPEKRQFNLAVLAIDYYRPIRALTATESIFFWLDGLSPLVGLLTDLNHTEKENHRDNYDMGRKNNEMSSTEVMLVTNSNCTKSESHDVICSKNHRNISDGVGVQEPLSDNSKSLIDNCDKSRVSDEITWTEEISLTNPDLTKSKSLCNNCNSNCNGNKVGGGE